MRGGGVREEQAAGRGLWSQQCFVSWPQLWVHGRSLYHYSLHRTDVCGVLFCSRDTFYPTQMSSENYLWWCSALVRRTDLSRFFAKVFAFPFKYVWLLTRATFLSDQANTQSDKAPPLPELKFSWGRGRVQTTTKNKIPHVPAGVNVIGK